MAPSGPKLDFIGASEVGWKSAVQRSSDDSMADQSLISQILGFVAPNKLKFTTINKPSNALIFGKV